MDLFIADADRRRRLTATLYDQLREAIATGRLAPGDRLPSSRRLAEELAVSRHTVTTVYGRLVAEGYLEGAAGAGTRVVVDPVPVLSRDRTDDRSGDSTGAPARGRTGDCGGHPSGEPTGRVGDPSRVPTGGWTGDRTGDPGGDRSGDPARDLGADPGVRSGPLRLRRSLDVPTPVPPGRAGRFDLRLGLPDPTFFPHDDWRRRVARELRAEPRGGYGDAAGEPVLREAIAAWVERARGVRAAPDRVVVTAGAQQAFDLVLAALVEPGDVVAVEDPGYVRFRDLARLRGARVVGVPVDAEGIVVDALPSSAKVVHVTPSHQFPLGSVLSSRRRRALLRWARAHDAAVIEDDYDTELRFAGRPLEPLHLLDDDGRVLYVATFSKTLSPSLRLGFVVAPRSLAPGLAALRQLVDWHGEPAAQRALAGFLRDGAMARHVHRARRRYAARRETVLRHADLGRLGRIVPSAAGLHVALELHEGIDEATLLTQARTAGIEIDGLSAYAVERPRPGLAISYGTAREDRLAEALDRLTR